MTKPAAVEVILLSSVALVRDKGLEGWSIERVANGAHCAKALVIHHYRNRPSLLRATGQRIAEMRLARRTAALAGGGTEALDRLWQTMVEDVETGLTKAVFGLAAHRYPTRRTDDPVLLHAAIATALDVPADAVADPIAVMAMLDGVEFQMLQADAPGAARPSFDRLWITLIEAA